ncbi:hypothetical protein SELMODRAFT_233330 [Selaginella moellendorffii]|uniref:3-oxoacyl-[acyl-carrier-protein] synthase n=1 Tax=Selaginella moellendorffii TaxID=88036 RepID=D8S7S2_SELML|nr:3-oxoacyl-[acyl-carrier-protein] synthase, mitochondrial [Selaginella moellendorffii]XP_024540166.1 3-oxoacyl-[acyl-carrier-protein] synthase, mitochondrial [Selaginella moellendorffii]EFJ19804.1 hypothetical protein SELMODRAFT_233330 [Selaginella moellendorffii]|eukprot:XP_002979396.1 3-oxoacyl-[acyl-carrier-protein] synthase, mitochondrial [Selaginella moellendorffii]
MRRFLSVKRARAASTVSSSIKDFGEPPILSQRRVVVTGLGLVSPLGCGIDYAWERLLNRKCGVRALKQDDLRLEHEDETIRAAAMNNLPSQVVAAVPYGTGLGDFKANLWMSEKKFAPFIAYAMCAAAEALSDADWNPSESDEASERTGVAIGGGIGCITDVLEAAQLIRDYRSNRLSPYFVPRILINMAAGNVSIKYKLKGPNHAAVTACASGAHSIGDAFRMVRFGDADVMIAGGTEASIDALSLAGFSRAKALSTRFNACPERASRPFDSDREGFVIGEGAGIMILEEYEHAKRRGAKMYAEIRGYGMSGDGHHITQPSEDGKGAVLAMNRALQQSGLKPNEIDYVNAHATSTPRGDKVEAVAIKTVFKEHAVTGNLAFSSTKGATGHLLGAAGAVEAIFSVLALHHGQAPPTLNLILPDRVFHDGFVPIGSTKAMSIHAVLSNSFGFGGTNASLVFTSPPSH